jgi:hypothetical protein
VVLRRFRNCSRLHPVAIVLQLFGVQVVAEAAESDHSTHPRGLRDRMALTMTLRRLLTEKLLAATIQAVGLFAYNTIPLCLIVGGFFLVFFPLPFASVAGRGAE